MNNTPNGDSDRLNKHAMSAISPDVQISEDNKNDEKPNNHSDTEEKVPDDPKNE